MASEVFDWLASSNSPNSLRNTLAIHFVGLSDQYRVKKLRLVNSLYKVIVTSVRGADKLTIKTLYIKLTSNLNTPASSWNLAATPSNISN